MDGDSIRDLGLEDAESVMAPSGDAGTRDISPWPQGTLRTASDLDLIGNGQCG